MFCYAEQLCKSFKISKFIEKVTLGINLPKMTLINF